MGTQKQIEVMLNSKYSLSEIVGNNYSIFDDPISLMRPPLTLKYWLCEIDVIDVD